MKNVEIKSRIIASLYHCYRLRGNGEILCIFSCNNIIKGINLLILLDKLLVLLETFCPLKFKSPPI